MIFRAKVVWFSAAEGQIHMTYQTLWKHRSSQMQEDQRQDLLEKWQILGLSFMMMSKTPEDFHDLVKQEFGYIWDGKGWMKEVSYQ